MTPTGEPPDRADEWGAPLVPREWWPDLAVGLSTFAAIGLLPLLLGGYVHERGFVQYALLWRELVGEAGRLPLETPKPLTTLRAALGMWAPSTASRPSCSRWRRSASGASRCTSTAPGWSASGLIRPDA